MSIIYREDKGAPLTIEELDNNFRDLDERVLKLEKLKLGRTIDSITINGQELIIKDQSGLVISSVQLPVIKFNPRGEWLSETDYVVNDLVVQQECIYICSQTHRSITFEDKYWQKLFELPQTKLTPILSIFKPKQVPESPQLGQIIGVVGRETNIVPHYWDGKNWIDFMTNKISTEI